MWSTLRFEQGFMTRELWGLLAVWNRKQIITTLRYVLYLRVSALSKNFNERTYFQNANACSKTVVLPFHFTNSSNFRWLYTEVQRGKHSARFNLFTFLCYAFKWIIIYALCPNLVFKLARKLCFDQKAYNVFTFRHSSVKLLPALMLQTHQRALL